MLTGITITCFAASYTVALVLELLRARVRNVWIGRAAIGFLIAGVLAQSLHLWNIASAELAQGVLFARWHDWCLLAAWVLALACLGLSLRRVPLIGMFMLPPVLALIGAAYLLKDSPAFERNDALRYWGMGHGFALLIGTVGVTIGFVAGLMFLLQSYRLKHKIPPSKTFKLPSLEWLQRLTEESLLISSFFLAVGLLSGVILNAIAHAKDNVTVAWSEPTVWSSGVLLLWLVAALSFNWLYKPARRGRKVAYLTMASFGFLAIVLGLVLFSEHAASGSARREGLDVCDPIGLAPMVSQVDKLHVMSDFQRPPRACHAGERGSNGNSPSHANSTTSFTIRASRTGSQRSRLSIAATQPCSPSTQGGWGLLATVPNVPTALEGHRTTSKHSGRLYA